jgi:hypothetical protein
MSSKDLELEVIESYKLMGEPRFRVRVKGTRMVINVHALNEEEALKKARKMLEDLLKGSPEREKELF